MTPLMGEHLPVSCHGRDQLTVFNHLSDAWINSCVGCNSLIAGDRAYCAGCYSLLPSLLPGLDVQSGSLRVRSLTQESPLRELLFVTLLVTFQEDLKQEIPVLLEDLFQQGVSDKYETLITVVFLATLFYGADFAKQAAKRLFGNGENSKKMLVRLMEDVASSTGKTRKEVEAIFNAKYGNPAPVKKLVSQVQHFFLPSHRDSNAAIRVDNLNINSETIAEVPSVVEADKPQDYDRYTPYDDAKLEIHAMDVDKQKTGWAAVADGVSDRRLKMRIMEPLTPEMVWGKSSVIGDIVVVSKLTSNGYVPSEIQLTAIK